MRIPSGCNLNWLGENPLFNIYNTFWTEIRMPFCSFIIKQTSWWKKTQNSWNSLPTPPPHALQCVKAIGIRGSRLAGCLATHLIVPASRGLPFSTFDREWPQGEEGRGGDNMAKAFPSTIAGCKQELSVLEIRASVQAAKEIH